jgi:hypothetical protein
MTDQPVEKSDQSRPQDAHKTGGGSSSGEARRPSTAPSSTLRDPAGLEFGDKTADSSKQTDVAKANDMNTRTQTPKSSADSHADDGEGHKGPRVDASNAPADNRSNPNRPASANQPKQQPAPFQREQQPSPKAPLGNVPAKPGSDATTAPKTPDTKPVQKQSGGTGSV